MCVRVIQHACSNESVKTQLFHWIETPIHFTKMVERIEGNSARATSLVGFSVWRRPEKSWPQLTALLHNLQIYIRQRLARINGQKSSYAAESGKNAGKQSCKFLSDRKNIKY